MSNLEQLLFERYQRWEGARVNMLAGPPDSGYLNIYHRVIVARKDWLACEKRNMERGARNEPEDS